MAFVLFFDAEGAGLVPDGPTMKEKPLMLLLHGGPGADHSLFKPSFGQLSDLAQLVFVKGDLLWHLRSARAKTKSCRHHCR